MNHNGLLPFHPQNMDLPEITVSNMLGQDGTLLSNSLSVVSFFSLSLLFCFKLQNRGNAELFEILREASSCPTHVMERAALTLGFMIALPMSNSPPTRGGGGFTAEFFKAWMLPATLSRITPALRGCRWWQKEAQGFDFCWISVWIQMAVVLFVWRGSCRSHLHVLRDVQKFNISFLVYRTFGKQQMLFLILGQIL